MPVKLTNIKTLTEVFPELKISRQYLNPGEYVDSETEKDSLAQHASQSERGDTLDDWWNQQPGRIAASWGVGKEGTLYFYFPDEKWAYHTGLGNYDSNIIGVEIINEAFLVERGGKFFWQAGTTWREYKGKVYDHKVLYNGYRFWASYTEEQLVAYAKLAAYLLRKHNIPCQMVMKLDYDPKVATFKGIINHQNISNQRSDPGPAFPYQRVFDMIQKYYNQISIAR